MQVAAVSATGKRADVAAIVAGITVLVAGMLAVRNGRVSGAEESVFRAVNDLPEWLYSLVLPLQQLGALVLGPIVAVAALVLRRYRLAIAALLVTALKLVTERLVKAAVSRERPGTSIGQDIELRGDVHVAGESFVSGHAVLVAALAGVVTPYLPGRWKFVPWAIVVAVMAGRVYVGAHNPLDVVCGAALGVAIAGVVNLVTGVHRQDPATEPRRAVTAADGGDPRDRPISATRSRVPAVALVVAVAVGCGDDREQPAAVSVLGDDAITVGSFDFIESVVLAEIYSQALEAAGYDVEREFALGPREFVGPALTSGLVELVPEYAGTAAEFHSLGAAEAGDAAATQAELGRALEGREIVALDAAPAQDANTFVVTRATARQLGLATLSDLAAVSKGLTLGGPPECPTRPYCLAGLTDVYGVQFGEFVALDAGGPLTRHALQQGHIDVALLFTTDPAIAVLGVVELADDRGLQPAEHITPLVRAEVVDRWGDDVVDVIDAVSARLTTESVRDLNAVAGAPDAEVPAIAAAWLGEVER